MKIVYFTEPNFLDCDLPLIREFQKANEVMVFIPLPPCFLKGSLLNIKQQIKKNGIIPASFFFALLIYGSTLTPRAVGVPANIVEVMQGLIIIVIVTTQMILQNNYLEDKVYRWWCSKKDVKEA